MNKIIIFTILFILGFTNSHVKQSMSTLIEQCSSHIENEKCSIDKLTISEQDIGKKISYLYVLYAAFQLDLFEALKDEFISIPEIKKKLELEAPERNILDFLDKLFVTGHLLREGTDFIDLSTIKYKNAHNFFIASNPENVIYEVKKAYDFIELSKEFEKVLLNGHLEQAPEYVDILETFSKQTLKDKNFEELNEFLEFKKYKSALDISGKGGSFCAHMKNINSDLKCVIVDVEGTQDIVSEVLDGIGVTAEIETRYGNIFEIEFPMSDVVTINNLLHLENEKRKLQLLIKAYNSVNENGLLIIEETLIDDKRELNDDALNLSLMTMTISEGYGLTFRELKSILKNVGLTNIQYHKNYNIIIGFK